jgi:hypothetical protein
MYRRLLIRMLAAFLFLTAAGIDPVSEQGGDRSR